MIAVGLERDRVYVGVKKSGQASVGKAIILLDIRVQVRRRSSSPQFGGDLYLAAVVARQEE
jgi:hypothetical protein